MIGTAAVFYAALVFGAAAFQMALAWGAPLGAYVLHGRFPGSLPGAVRAGAAVQSGLLLAMGTVMLGEGGAIDWTPPRWSVWATVAVTALSAGANVFSPAPKERRLWGPVTAAMLAACLVITVGSARA